MIKTLFCDVETTGIDSNKHGIIQIAGLIDIDGEIVEEFDIRLKPFKGQMISKESMNINGVSIEDLNKFLEPTEGYSKFVEILSKYVSKFDKNDKYFFIGYNSSFDDNFLRALFKNCGDDYYGSYIWWPTIDVSVFAMEFLKEQRHLFPNFKLGTIAKTLSIPIDETRLHEAKYDSILTREIYRKIVLGIG
jgi:DNA polymerase III subunit epsilon